MKPFKRFVAIFLLLISFSLSTITYGATVATNDDYDFSCMFAYAKNDATPLYESPSEDSSVLDDFSAGDLVIVTDQIDDIWYKVENGHFEGYCRWDDFKFEDDELTDELIGCSIIHYKSSFNRDTNISIAASKIDGMVIAPDERFVWSEVVGNPLPEDGYLDAPIILNRKAAVGVGGGICQVSTALYNAVLDTEIPDSAIHVCHHSTGCAYADKNKDATVAYGSKDFYFKNTYDFPIKIRAYSYKAIVVVELYKVVE